MLYAPSYISLLYALSYYNLIPEKVSSITSITTKRKKEFRTPIGTFIYYALKREYYSLGISWKKQDKNRGFFIASPEKAIIDKLYFENVIQTQKEMSTYLFENLRIDESNLREFDVVLLENILQYYKKITMLNLIKILKKL